MELHELSTFFQLAPARLQQPELLDLGWGTPADVAANLAEMQRINDLLGGTRSLTRHLYPRLLVQLKPVTLLDLGTGGAGLPHTIAHWARRVRLPLQILAMDWAGRNLSVAAGGSEAFPEIHLVQADALQLPVAPGQVDYVISSLFLHHLSPEQVLQLLRQSFRLAQRGLVMSDLVRGWLPYFAFQCVQPLFARHYLTRHDGLLSVRRAYTAAELLDLAHQAGLRGARVYTHFPWRMTLVAEK